MSWLRAIFGGFLATFDPTGPPGYPCPSCGGRHAENPVRRGEGWVEVRCPFVGYVQRVQR